MRAVPINIKGIEVYRTGTIIGKSLEEFDLSNEDEDQILILVNLK